MLDLRLYIQALKTDHPRDLHSLIRVMAVCYTRLYIQAVKTDHPRCLHSLIRVMAVC